MHTPKLAAPAETPSTPPALAGSSDRFRSALVAASATHAKDGDVKSSDEKPSQERKSPAEPSQGEPSSILRGDAANSVRAAIPHPSSTAAIPTAHVSPIHATVLVTVALPLPPLATPIEPQPKAKATSLSPLLAVTSSDAQPRAAAAASQLPLLAVTSSDAQPRAAAATSLSSLSPLLAVTSSDAQPRAAAAASQLPLLAVTSSDAQPRAAAAAAAIPVPESSGQAKPVAATDVNIIAGSSASASVLGAATVAVPATDHEAVLRTALMAAQGGSTVLGLPDGMASMIVGPTAKTSKGVTTAQLKSPPAPLASADSNSGSKLAASNEVSSQDASSAGQGGTQEQGNGKSQAIDQTTAPDLLQAANLSQVANLVAHAGTVAVTTSNTPLPALHMSAPMNVPGTPDAPATQSAAAPQPVPAAMPMVSSAKLIQSIQQSGMRVAMNSPEFGAISIHTSTERGILSSEITLGHLELARTINAHLNAAQQLPGLPQTFSVRVDTSSSTAADSGGTSQQSTGGSRQQEPSRPSQTNNNTESQPWAEHRTPTAARSLDATNARLDILI